MRLLLIADPTSPNGEDGFCRELARRAAERGHEIAAALAGCDAVFINSLQPAALRDAKAAGKPAALRLIDSYAATPPDALDEIKRLVLQAELVLVPSRYLADIVCGWGANGQVRRVPYAYDRVAARQIAVVTLRASRPAFQLVAASPLDESTRAGYDTLILAVARLRLECHLSIIGDGPALPALRERVQQLIASDRVSFLPPMPHAKMMEFFRAAKAYVDPCGVGGFPTLALYALSEGCPVVAARSGATAELICDGQNGLLYPPGDVMALSEQIVTLFSVRGLSLRLIAEGIKTVGTHSWDETILRTYQELETLKGNGARTDHRSRSER